MEKSDKADKAEIVCRTIPLWPDAAKMLGISRNLAFEGAAKGTIPTLRIGRRVLVPLARLEALLGETAGAQRAL